METLTMPKKKRAGTPKAVGVSIKVSREWVEWLRRGAEHSGLSLTDVLDQGARLYLKRQGFDKPAPKR